MKGGGGFSLVDFLKNARRGGAADADSGSVTSNGEEKAQEPPRAPRFGGTRFGASRWKASSTTPAASHGSALVKPPVAAATTPPSLKQQESLAMVTARPLANTGELTRTGPTNDGEQLDPVESLGAKFHAQNRKIQALENRVREETALKGQSAEERNRLQVMLDTRTQELVEAQRLVGEHQRRVQEAEGSLDRAHDRLRQSNSHIRAQETAYKKLHAHHVAEKREFAAKIAETNSVLEARGLLASLEALRKNASHQADAVATAPDGHPPCAAGDKEDAADQQREVAAQGPQGPQGQQHTEQQLLPPEWQELILNTAQGCTRCWEIIQSNFEEDRPRSEAADVAAGADPMDVDASTTTSTST